MSVEGAQFTCSHLWPLSAQSQSPRCLFSAAAPSFPWLCSHWQRGRQTEIVQNNGNRQTMKDRRQGGHLLYITARVSTLSGDDVWKVGCKNLAGVYFFASQTTRPPAVRSSPHHSNVSCWLQIGVTLPFPFLLSIHFPAIFLEKSAHNFLTRELLFRCNSLGYFP